MRTLKKLEAATIIAAKTTNNIIAMFEKCLEASMPNQPFLTDNLQSFINFPPKTTVGFAPKFTANRKFFANMINTAAFKDLLEKDEDLLRRNLIKKLKYCDEAVMDHDILTEFYDREVDPANM